MKKTILLIVLVLTSSVSFSQIEIKKNETPVLIGKIAPMGAFMASLDKYSTHYSLTFNDAKYKTITNLKSFIFSIEDFEAISSIFTKEDPNAKKGDSYTVKLPLDGGSLYIQYDSMLGKIYPTIAYTDTAGIVGIFPYFTNKQYLKLFGKK
ncbi:MAG: hypothetical protein NTX74_02300 [Flavobacterium sp.]|nr:hypothetical protein [Flavobacterium sp.]